MKVRYHLLTFLKNLKWAFARSGIEDHLGIERRVATLERQMKLLQPDRTVVRDLQLFEDVLNSNNRQFEEEVNYCRNRGRLEEFPYEKTREFPAVEVHLDAEKKLQYVLHGGKRLYYPADWGAGRIAFSYTNAVAIEGILGDGCLAKSPHNYLDSRFPVKEGAVVCDFGAAEGLVALHLAERASYLVIGECDPQWLPPLRATFEPYAEKTTFVTEPLGMGKGEMPSIRIFREITASLKTSPPFFLKFDIEGAERFAICGMAGFFQGHPDVTVACAAYHRQDDRECLEGLFRGWGYETSFSDGAMLFLLDRLVPPFFRPGVLYAKKS